MKLFLLSLFLFYFLISSSQSFNQNDDYALKKYTYLVISYKTKTTNSLSILNYPDLRSVYTIDTLPIRHSSGFFIKSKRKLFFVSCYHSIFGVDTYNKKLMAIRPEIISIGFWNDTLEKYEYHYLDMNRIDISNPEIFSLNEKPDLFIYEVKEPIPPSMKIHSIEKMISNKKIDYSKIEKTLLWGFNLQQPFSREFAPPDLNEIAPVLYEGWILDNGSCNALPNIDSLNIQVANMNHQGSSGGPLFFLIDSKKGKEIKFGGVQLAISEKGLCSVVLKEEEVRKALKRIN